MSYFSKHTLQFLSQLEKNNNRDWFNANKGKYQQDVKEPFEYFIGDLIEALQPHFETLAITPKDAIFRIYRDVRFSKDKSPYKIKISALITKGGRKDMTSPGVYLEISAADTRCYSGLYKLSTKQLFNVRTHISYNLEKFKQLINEPLFAKTFGEIRGEKNKRIAKEFEEDGIQQPLMYNKSFYFFTAFSSDIILSDDLIKKFVESFIIAKPLSEFLFEGLEG